MPVVIVAAVVFGFAATVVLVPACRVLARRIGCVAAPKTDRWHRTATPLLGGVAIALPVILGAGYFAESRIVMVPIACAAAMFLVGIVDDLHSIKPVTKLVAQIVVASILVWYGYRLHWVDSLTLDTLLTLVWIVGVTNAFNLLDNMDGLAAGVALIGAAGLLATVVAQGETGARAVYLALLAGSACGFLVYNVHPASIFMGDSGSLFLGLSLAVLTLSNLPTRSAESDLLTAVAGPLLVLLIPIFDTTLVTISRVMYGRRPSQGGRDHSSHRLVAIGLPERTAVAVLWVLAGLGAAVSWSLHQTDEGWSTLTSVIVVLAMIIFAVYLGRVRVYEREHPDLLGGRVTLFVSQLMYKRRIAEVVLDLCLIAIAYYAAWRLRFEDAAYSVYFPYFLESLPIVLGIQMLVFTGVGVYRGVWRYFALMDAVTLAKAVVIGVLCVVGVLVYLYRFENYSRGVFIIYATTLLLLVAGSRASFRLIAEFAVRRRQGGRLVIYGAGEGGALALREIRNTTNARMLGFIDDATDKQRARVLGYPVLGGFEVLSLLIAEGAVDAVVISTIGLDPTRLVTLQELCDDRGVELSRLRIGWDRLAPGESRV